MSSIPINIPVEVELNNDSWEMVSGKNTSSAEGATVTVKDGSTAGTHTFNIDLTSDDYTISPADSDAVGNYSYTLSASGLQKVNDAITAYAADTTSGSFQDVKNASTGKTVIDYSYYLDTINDGKITITAPASVTYTPDEDSPYKDQLIKTIKEVVSYGDPNTTADTTISTQHFYRTVTVTGTGDEATVVYGNWTTNANGTTTSDDTSLTFDGLTADQKQDQPGYTTTVTTTSNDGTATGDTNNNSVTINAGDTTDTDDVTITRAVTYAAEQQTAKVIYIDDDTADTSADGVNGKKVLHTETLTGDSNSAIPFDTQSVIAIYTGQKYEIVSDDTTSDAIFDTDTGADQTYYVHLKHSTTTDVTPPTDADDPYYDETHKTYTIRVTAEQPAGTVVDVTPEDATQDLVASRTYTIDNVTKEITAFGDWTLDADQTYTTVKAVSVSGWTAKPDSVTQADFQTDLNNFIANVDDDDATKSFDITYTAGKSQSAFVDFIDDDSTVDGQPISDANGDPISDYDSIELNGYAGTLVQFDMDAIDSDITAIEALGYELVSNGVDTSARYDFNTAQNQFFEIHFKHKITTPTVPSTTTDPNYAATHKAFTVTVTGALPDGTDETPVNSVQTIKYERTVTLDAVTNAVVKYGAWTLASDDFKNVTARVVPEYTASQTTVTASDIQTAYDKFVSGDADDSTTVNITYTRSTFTPENPGTDDQTNTDALTKSVTEKIVYVDPITNAQTEADGATYEFYRTVTVTTDATSGDSVYTYGAWTTDASGDATKGANSVTMAALTAAQTKAGQPQGYELDAVASTLDGVAAGANVDVAVPAGDQNATADMVVTRTVTYTASTQSATINYVDKTTGATISSNTLTGGSNSLVNFGVPNEVATLISKGYALVNDDNYTAALNAKYDTDTTANQTFNVYFTEVTSGDPKVPDDPSDPYYDATHKGYTVTATGALPDGTTETPTNATQTISFVRTYQANAATGVVVYGDWTLDGDDFATITAKTVANYTADPAAIAKADTDLATFQAADTDDDGSATFTITYTQTTFTPDNPGTTPGVNDTDALTSKITYDVTYELPAGTESDAQVVTNLYRTATLQTDGSYSYSPWTTSATGISTSASDQIVTFDPLTDTKAPAGYSATVATTVDGADKGANTTVTIVASASNDDQDIAVQRTVTYTAASDTEAVVQYLDEDQNDAQVRVDTPTGATDSTSQYTVAVPAGYVIDTAKSNYTDGEKIGITFKADTSDNVKIYLQHKTTDVPTVTDPGDPTPVDPENPDGPKTGTYYDDTNATVTQTITYVKADGSTAAPTLNTPLSFTRTVTIDEVTGAVVSTGDWAPTTTDTFAAVDSPDVDGYTPDQATVAAVTGVTGDSQNSNVTVTYTANTDTTANVTYVDTTTGAQVGTTATVMGTTDAVTDYTVVVPAGYKLATAQSAKITNGKVTITLKADDTDDVTIYLDHTTTTVTPIDVTDNPSDPIDPDNPNGPKNGDYAADTTKTVTETVQYVGTGKNAASFPVQTDGTATVTFTRDIVVDEVTGKVVSYGDWNATSADFDDVTSPTVDGWTADQTMVSGSATPADSDASHVVTVSYTQDDVTTPVTPVDGAGNPIPGTTPTDVTGKPGDPITAPTVPGYTPDPGQTPTIPADGTPVNITYTANQQTAIVNYVDLDAKAGSSAIGTDTTITGGSNSAISHDDVATEIAALEAQGYVLATDGVLNQTFDTDDAHDQTFTVTFTEGSSTTTPTDANDPDYAQTHKDFTVTTTINKPAALTADVTPANGDQTIKFTRTVTTNAVTNAKTYGDWTLDGDDFATITATTADGYTVTPTSVTKADTGLDAFITNTTNAAGQYNATFNYTATSHDYTITPVTDDGTPVPGTTATPATGYTGDPITTPTPLKGWHLVPGIYVVPTTDTDVPVTYAPNAQTGTVTFIDDTTGATLKVDTVTGYTGGTIDFTAANADLDKFVSDGYVKGDSDVVEGTTFDDDDTTVQPFTIHLTEGSDEPHTPTNTDDPDYDATHKAYTVTITTDQPSTLTTDETPSNAVQTVSYVRTVATNSVSGDKTYGDWTLDGDDFTTINAQTVDGYTVAPTSFTASDVGLTSFAKSSDADDDSFTGVIKYNANTQTAAVTITDTTTGKTLQTINLTGKTGENIDFSTVATAVKGYTDNGYVVATDETTAGDQYDDQDGTTQQYSVTLTEGTDGPTTPTDTTDTDYAATHKTFTVDVTVNKPATLTDDVTPTNANQTLNYTRTVTTNKVTGAKTYGNWTLAGDDFSAITATSEDGYTVTPSDISRATTGLDTFLAGTDATGSYAGTITYTAQTQTAVVTFTDEDTGKTLAIKTLTGATGAAIDFSSVAAEITALTGKGYQLDVDETAAGDSYDNDTTATQQYSVTFTEGTDGPTTPTDTTDPDYDATHKQDVITVTVNQPSSLSTDMTPDNAVQTVQFIRTVTTNKVTNMKTYGAWTLDGDDFVTVTAKSAAGYGVTPASVERTAVGLDAFAADTSDTDGTGSATITYTADSQTAQVKFYDDTTGALLDAVTLNGKSGDAIDFSDVATETAAYEQAGYEVVSDDTAAGANYDTDDGAVQPFAIHLSEKTTTTTPTTTDDPNYDATHKSYTITTNVVKPDSLTADVTPANGSQTINLVRTTTYNAVTKATTYGGWTVDGDDFATITATTVDGYDVTPASITADDTGLAAFIANPNDGDASYTGTITYTATTHGYTVVPKDPAGNPIPGTTPTDGTGKTGDPIEVPDIPGYTPDPTDAKQRIPNDDGDVYVKYTPDTQSALVTYKDLTTGSTITTTSLTGVSDADIDFTDVQTEIATLEAQGYVLVDDGTAAGAKYDTDDAVVQPFTVTFNEGTTGPHTPTDTTDTDYATTHKQYAVTTRINKPSTLTQDVTPANATQTLQYVRTVDTNNVTGVKTYGDWTLDGDDFATITAVTVAGYDVTPASVTAADTDLSDFVADKGQSNGSFQAEFTYTATEHGYTVVPKDPEGNPIPGTTPTDETGKTGDPINVPNIPGYTPDPTGAKQLIPGDDGDVYVPYTPDAQNALVTFKDTTTGAILDVQSLNGVSDADIDFTDVQAEITALEAKGYVLASDGTAAGAKYDTDDAATQQFEVDFTEGTTGPTTPTDTGDKDYAATHKTYTVTTLVNQPSTLTADMTPDNANQTVNAKRTVDTNKVTGAKTYGNWTLDGDDFATITAKVATGYSVSPATITKDDTGLAAFLADTGDSDGTFAGTITYTATEHGYTVVPKDPDGDPIPGTTPTDETGKTGDPINVPNIPGYTPDPTGTKQLIPGDDGDVYVPYTPDAQSAVVTYKDLTSGKTIDFTQLSGVSDADIDFTDVKAEIATLEDAGYVLVNDETAAGAKYDTDDAATQQFTVTFNEGTTGPHTPTDTNDTDFATTHKQYDVKTKINKPSALTTDVTPANATQTLQYVRTVDTNNVTGVKTYGDWTLDGDDFATITPVAVDGYDVTPASVTATDTDLSDFVADSDDNDGSFTAEFTYTATEHGYTVVPKDPEGNPIPGTTPTDETGKTGDPINVPNIPGYTPDPTGSKQLIPGDDGDVYVPYTPNAQTALVTFKDTTTGATIDATTLNGVSDADIDFTDVQSEIASLEAKGYVLTSDGTAAGAKYDTDDKATQQFEVDFTEGTTGPTTPTNTDDPDYDATHKRFTITTTVSQPSALTADMTPANANQTVNAKRTVDINKVTGAKTYGAWTLDGDDFATITAKTVEGYTASPATITKDDTGLDAFLTDTGDSDDSDAFTITYTAKEHGYTVVPKGPDGNPIPGTNPTDETGKTGEPINVPNIPGYTPDPTGSKQLIPGGDGDVYVPYTPDAQTAVVTFKDTTTGAIIDTTTLNGVSDADIDFTDVQSTITALEAKGYILTSDGTKGGAKYDTDDAATQQFEVDFTEGTTGPTTPSDTDDPDYDATHKNYGVNVMVDQPDTLTADLTPTNASQTIHFTRTVDTNKVTGAKTYGDWTLDGDDFATITAQTAEGYTVTPASLTKDDTDLDDFAADDDADDDTFNATFAYTATSHGYTVVPKDPEGNPIPGTTPTDETGKTGDPINVPDIPGYTPDPTGAKQLIPGGDGAVSVPYTANTQTATINFVDQDGNVIRSLTVTGGSDTAIDHSGVATVITALTADGYTLVTDGTLNATFDHDDNATQTLTVTLNQKRTLPSTGGDTAAKPATPAKPAAPATPAQEPTQPAATTTSTTTRTLPSTGGAQRSLPQTGDDQTNLLSALGLGMVGMLGLFGLAGKKRKHEDQ
ncbi:mucin-binding protein [uncultured Lacticaseibacillus sp.]|uniref:mucin-binding protein n=1 Tax=uncultured Lacticaseibacillus sp. TaxID=2775882 RepID=UPI00259A7C4C|nr:LPXTG cell wall anchor domain-containing protein [uncultured Lacticaseibacillus sp.]